MDVDNDSEMEEIRNFVDPIEKLRNNQNIPRDDLKTIEIAREIFLRFVRDEPEIALHAYGYGLTIGAYVGAEEAVPEAARLIKKAHQSEAGKASGAKRRDSRRWTANAERLALQIRTEDASLSQDDVASKISERWEKSQRRPRHATLKAFISELESEGRLPKRVPEKKKKS